MSVGTVAAWVERTRGKRLERAVFANRKPGRSSNRTAPEVESRILSTRRTLREESVPGEYGADAIGSAPRVETSIKHDASGATIADGQGQATLVDDDPPPSLRINDVTVAEGNAGSANAVFTVTLSAASGQNVTVLFASANDTARAALRAGERSIL